MAWNPLPLIPVLESEWNVRYMVFLVDLSRPGDVLPQDGPLSRGNASEPPSYTCKCRCIPVQETLLIRSEMVDGMCSCYYMPVYNLP